VRVKNGKCETGDRFCTENVGGWGCSVQGLEVDGLGGYFDTNYGWMGMGRKKRQLGGEMSAKI